MIARGHLIASVLGLGTINALIRPVARSLADSGWSAPLESFGISLVIWATIAWSLSSIWQSGKRKITRFDVLIVGMAVIVFLIPSATIAWLGTAIAAGLWYISLKSRDDRMAAGLLVLVAASLRDPISTLALTLFAGPLLDGDALLVNALVGILGDSGPRAGNVLIGPNGFQMAVMTGCSSFTNVSLALLAWFTITLAVAGGVGQQRAIVGGAVALAVITINVGRMAYMVQGPEAYAFAHDGLGVQLSEAAMIAATLTLSLWGVRRA